MSRASVRGALLTLLFLSACRDAPREFRIVAEYPHDPSAYTQGLELHGGTLFESTGLHGRSSIRKVRPGTGEVVQQRALPREYFGEGMTRVEDRLIQLTWREGRAFVYDTTDLTTRTVIEYDGEGWGLCYDGSSLYMSDGSEYLLRRDPASFALLDSVRVTLDGGPLTRLNELECVGEDVLANVYRSDWIVRIDKGSGKVSAVYSLAPLVRESGKPASRDAVLNGIAYDSATDTYLVTGKLWPRLFRIRLLDQPDG